ncbi:MAG: YceH family protein [Melioribacteraceae bacterium]|jgi:uncharacterized protein YceH (UPF0502 family)|nr:YceH family protein [Melioribacteraceae bacterium]
MEILSFEEVRIIGALIEKEYATPEYYPLTINSLTNACNQKSSRNPVVSFDENLVKIVIEKLREKALVAKVTGPDFRVPKYRQLLADHYNLLKPQLAVLCVLFLRGAQTIGEIKSRSYRVYEFRDLAETEETIEGLIKIENGPFVIKLPKEQGRENRYTHLFSGEPIISEQVKEPSITDRLDFLENEVSILKDLYSRLNTELENFKKSFD